MQTFDLSAKLLSCQYLGKLIRGRALPSKMASFIGNSSSGFVNLSTESSGTTALVVVLIATGDQSVPDAILQEG
jgi:hypothetical protein